MNREIKFRAYIHSLKMMLERVDVYADGNIGITVDNLPEEFGKLYHIYYDDMCIRENGTYNHVMNILTGEDYIWFESGFDLMQYTGLEDKNGTEIYEGDIAQKTSYPKENIVVLFERGKFNICIYLQSSLKVIGNIYENTELLK